MARKKNKVVNIGTITKEQIRTNERKISREMEIEADPHKGFKSMHKVHQSDKTYKRHSKHKGQAGY
jgi:hypothetical protein